MATSEIGPNDNVWEVRPPRSSCMYMCREDAVGVLFLREIDNLLSEGQSPWFLDGAFCENHLTKRLDNLSTSEWISDYKHRKFP